MKPGPTSGPGFSSGGKKMTVDFDQIEEMFGRDAPETASLIRLPASGYVARVQGVPAAAIAASESELVRLLEDMDRRRYLYVRVYDSESSVYAKYRVSGDDPAVYHRVGFAQIVSFDDPLDVLDPEVSVYVDASPEDAERVRVVVPAGTTVELM